jgi:uncharacterized protein with GYD domain
VGPDAQESGDRAAAVRDLASSVGGSIEALYFMFGDRDGFFIIDVPEPSPPLPSPPLPSPPLPSPSR